MAENAHTPTRRTLLANLAVATSAASATAATIPPAGADAELLGPGAAWNQDEALIRICAGHEGLRNAVEAYPGQEDAEEARLWAAYRASIDAIHAAEPQTMAGILAIARVAKVEAAEPEGEEPAHTPAADWAWNIVNDLLRLYGQPGGRAA